MADHTRKDEEYNWLDDPFDETKQTKFDRGMSTGGKVAIGCVFAVVAIALFIAGLLIGMFVLSAQ